MLCNRCGASIKLSLKSAYDPFHWHRHRERCLKRLDAVVQGMKDATDNEKVRIYRVPCASDDNVLTRVRLFSVLGRRRCSQTQTGPLVPRTHAPHRRSDARRVRRRAHRHSSPTTRKTAPRRPPTVTSRRPPPSAPRRSSPAPSPPTMHRGPPSTPRASSARRLTSGGRRTRSGRTTRHRSTMARGHVHSASRTTRSARRHE